MFRRIAPAVLSLAAITACGGGATDTVTVNPVTRYAEGQVLYLNRLEVSAAVKGCDSLYKKYGDESYQNIKRDNISRILGRYPAKTFDSDAVYVSRDGRLSLIRESNETPETLRQLTAQLIEFACEDPEKK